jgi:putative phage-type endonuclease
MNSLDLIQGTEAWLCARCGSLGASSIHEAVARTKTGWGASRENVMARLIIERLTGRPQETYVNAAMKTGVEREPEGRSAYEFYKGVEVVEVGIIRHPTITGSHASPDGLVGNDGLLEIKCPQPAKHLSTLLDGKIDDKYILQMQWQMQCADRQWCDFVSYNPDFPEEMSLWTTRIKRDDKRISETEKLVIEFLEEVAAKVAKLRSYGGHDAIGEDAA